MWSLLLAMIILPLSPRSRASDSPSPHDGPIQPAPDIPQTDPARPRIDWPVEEAYRRLYPDRVAVLEPVFPDLPETDWNVVITYAGAKLEARNPSTGRTLWPQPVPSQAQPILLGMDEGRFVFATAHRIFAITRTTGRTAWQFGSRPPADPGADPESFTAWTSHLMTDDRLYAASDRGDLVCIDLHDGTLRWRIVAPASRRCLHVGGAIAADQRHVFFHTRRGGQNTIALRDAETGRPSRAVRLDDDLPIHALQRCASLLLVVQSKAVTAIDPTTGKTRWRIGTPDHFVLSTLQIGSNAFFASADGRRITKHDPADGRVLWRTPPIGSLARQGIWSEVSEGTLFVASTDELMAFDAAAHGRILWRAEDPPGLTPQSPRLTQDAVVTIEPHKANGRTDRSATTQPAERPVRAARQYGIRRFDRTTGRQRPVTTTGQVVTEPLESFGGLFLRDNCLILLDGNRLIGYVARRPPNRNQTGGTR